MKIAIDIREAGGEKAGKGWFTFRITQNLLKLDTQNQYILYTKDRFAGFDQFKNATVKQIEKSGLAWHRKVARNIKSENVDIFFAPSSYIIPALLPSSVKTVLTIHDLVAFLYPKGHSKKATIIERLYLKRAIKKSTRIVAVSQNTKRDLIKHFKTSSDKISVIYPSTSEMFKPILKSELQDFAKKTQLPDKFFLAVGTVIPRKNYANLIKAFAKIKAKLPNYHIVIVGSKGWQYEEIFEEVRKNRLQDFVHFLGYISGESLQNLYCLATALVFPSLYEGFGIPPLEAMSSGCPVIASSKGSVPEVTQNAALSIDPENDTEISNAMLKIATDSEFAETLRNRGLIQSKKFSWLTSAEKLLQIIKSLVNS